MQLESAVLSRRHRTDCCHRLQANEWWQASVTKRGHLPCFIVCFDRCSRDTVGYRWKWCSVVVSGSFPTMTRGVLFEIGCRGSFSPKIPLSGYDQYTGGSSCRTPRTCVYCRCRVCGLVHPTHVRSRTVYMAFFAFFSVLFDFPGYTTAFFGVRTARFRPLLVPTWLLYAAGNEA